MLRFTSGLRAPHQTISHAGLVGGGNWPQPGEISLAQGSLTFPANFQLVAAMNPCPCGYYGDPVKECTYSPSVVTRYQKRISGPLLDRVDIHVEVPRVEHEELSGVANLLPFSNLPRRRPLQTVVKAPEKQLVGFYKAEPQGGTTTT